MSDTRAMAISPDTLRDTVTEVVRSQPVTDVHTHLYSAEFGDLLLWGIDDLLTYHYLTAEVVRATRLPYDAYWSMSKSEQADLVWRVLFVENSPISEACRGVVTTLSALGLDPGDRDLRGYREHFARLRVDEYIDTVLDLANVGSVVMTNDLFDPAEHAVWRSDRVGDPRFRAALRLDPLLNDYDESGCDALSSFGYQVDPGLSDTALAEIRRFLADWIGRMDPKYMAVSLPPTYRYPEDSTRGAIIQECVLPVSRELNVPFALMIGVTRAVNPHLRSAGDGMAKCDLTCLANMLRENPENKLLATVLSRENQHELCVLGRKFPNLMIFGCWWFLNNPSIVEEITRERIELLGLSVTRSTRTPGSSISSSTSGSTRGR